MTAAIVLLSGGMDSAVALKWAMLKFDIVQALHFRYSQRSESAEYSAAHTIFMKLTGSSARFIALPISRSILVAQSSILGDSKVDTYNSPDEAKAGTSTDKAYIPIRNAVFVTLAAHQLLARYPDGGAIVLGTRARFDGAGGFPDCTPEFAMAMSAALRVASGQDVQVLDPLNTFTTGRASTIKWAQEIDAFDLLQYTVSCYMGKPPCGKCLPCQRRAQAFAEVGIPDPAL